MGWGAALGLQSAANSLGHTSGPFLGGALFVWQMNAPYVLTAAFLVSVAFAVAGTRGASSSETQA